jgi:serine protease Do
MKVPRKTMALLSAVFALAGAVLAAAGSAAGIEDKKIEDITRITAPSVVRVEARDGIRKVATGVVLDKDGFIATTALISPRDEEILVTTTDGKTYKADFKGFDTQTGVALLQVKAKGLLPIAAGSAPDMKPGAWIGVVGLSPENSPAITQGIISSLSPNGLRLNVWVVPGSSGAPVVNASGQMIGLLRGTYIDDQPVFFEFRERNTIGSGFSVSRGQAPAAGMALAVPMDIVASVAADIRKNGKVMRGWLGVSTPAGEIDGKVVIVGIDPKSPAEAAKLREGDIVLKLDGKDLITSLGLAQEIRARKPGTDITLRIERDGKPMDVKLKVGELSEDSAHRELEIRFPNLFPQLGPRPPRGGNPPPQLKAPFDGPRWEKRKYIGAALQPLNKELAEAWGAKDGYGVLVVSLDEDGSARKAGLKVGDIILKADGRKVEDADELSGFLQNKKKGDKIKLDVVRDKKPLTIDVPVAEDEKNGAGLFREPEDLS